MTQYIQKSGCETTYLDNEWIVMNVDEFTVTKLNEVGGFCWSLLKNAQTVDSLAEAIQHKFQHESEINPTEIEEFLSQLVDCGLVLNDL